VVPEEDQAGMPMRMATMASDMYLCGPSTFVVMMLDKAVAAGY
jgi:hypothetical protein